MIEIRKGRTNERELILDFIDNVFKPYRSPDFSFKKLIPRVYDSSFSFPTAHHLLFSDNTLASTAANLINDFTFSNKSYRYSLVGSVATDARFSNRGYMKMLMDEIDLENIKENVVFSALMGDRKRYSYYGYEVIGGFAYYSFDKHFLSYNRPKGGIVFKSYNESENKAYFELYNKNELLSLRKLNDFSKSLANNEVTGIYRDSSLIGYYAYNSKTREVIELELLEIDCLKDIIIHILMKTNNDFKIKLSPLKKSLCEALDKIFVTCYLENSLNLKVYKLKEFLNLVIELNLKNKAIDNLNLVYKIDDEIIEISIFKNNLYINEANKPYLKEFKKSEFIRYIFNPINNDNPLFPLYFNILDADLF